MWILVAGADCGAVAEALAQVPGVLKVICADNGAYEHQLAENVSLLVAELGLTTTIFWRLRQLTARTLCRAWACLLDVGQISDILAVESADTFKRPIYAVEMSSQRFNPPTPESDHRSDYGL